MSSLILVGTPGAPPSFTNTSSGDFTFSGALFATGNSRVYARLTVSQSGVTGDGTTANLICNTTPQSQGGSIYNTTTGVCTFDRTGWWVVTFGLDISGLTAAHTSGDVRIVSSVETWRPWIGNPIAISAAGNAMFTGSVTERFTAFDTLTVNTTINGGAAGSVSINQFTSYFSAAFLG